MMAALQTGDREGMRAAQSDLSQSAFGQQFRLDGAAAAQAREATIQQQQPQPAQIAAEAVTTIGPRR